MRRVVVALSTLAVLLVAVPGHADLSEKKLLRLWGKYITEPLGDLAKPKAACVYRPGSPNPVNLGLGYIRASKAVDGHWYAACWIPEIVDGEVVSESGCGGEFEILSRQARSAAAETTSACATAPNGPTRPRTKTGLTMKSPTPRIRWWS